MLSTRRWRRAVLVLFFTNGVTFASFFPRLPEVRDRLGLSLGGLGAVLVAIGLGGLVSSVAAGAVVDRTGSRRAAVGAAVTIGVVLPLVGIAPTPLLLAASLMALSAVDALADIAMNAQAAEVQRVVDRSVVQRFHAAWSIGAVVGAAIATGAAAVGVGLTAQLAVTGLALAVLAAWTWPALPAGVTTPDEGGGADVRRWPAVAVLVATAVAVAVVEGTPGDWAALFGTDVHDAAPGVAGLGYVAVASGMVLGRLAGDRATDRFGAGRLFTTALAVVGGGLAVVALSPNAGVAIGGFLVIGCGSSVLFPALYLRAATTPGVPAGFGLGVMSSGARLGFLLSPPVVGSVSAAVDLRFGLVAVAGTAVVAALLLGSVGRRLVLSGGAGR